MANTVEVFRDDVEHEAADELYCRDGHILAFTAVSRVSVAESDLPIFEGDQPLI